MGEAILEEEIKPKLLRCISSCKMEGTLFYLLINLLYKALLKLGMGSKHDSLTVFNVWKMFKEDGTKMDGKFICSFELFSYVCICNFSSKWDNLKPFRYGVIMWPRAWESDPKFLGNVILWVCIWSQAWLQIPSLELTNRVTLSKFFGSLSVISQSGQQHYLTGLESELSRMMYIKCLDSDQDKVTPEQMVTTQF